MGKRVHHLREGCAKIIPMLNMCLKVVGTGRVPSTSLKRRNELRLNSTL